MAVELEIKLTLSERAQAQALEWLLAQPEAKPGGQKLLVNRYYDTPDAALNQAKAALRVRQAGDRYIQTLKTQGEFVDGAHRRQEWEWPLPGPELDLSLLEDTPLKQRLDMEKFQVAFETNFTRQVVMLETADALVEVAVDCGEVVGGGRSHPLCEVEFELKSGSPSLLFSWAKALAVEVPVLVNLISKAEHGYYLAGITGREARVAEDGECVNGFLRALSDSWLTGAVLVLPEDCFRKLTQKSKESGCHPTWREVEGFLRSGCNSRDLLDHLPRLGFLQLALSAG